MTTLIISGRRILDNFILPLCTFLAVLIVWRGVDYGDMIVASMCIALGFSLIFTGIAASDEHS
ncbi:MAG TPA: hypothetical protein VGQ99_21840 [Tepidisphaeraceae bacterium]|jgi:4-amino-4-deoxy-L-arabinose transferase-like glycosyltransferase|nr:hypothetical protein [Tepidisphaeraceae bacterium]